MEYKNRPGAELPEYQQYETRLEDGVETGFSKAGRFYKFNDNESLIHQRNNESGRDTYVKLEDGTLVPVENWIEENS